MLFRNTWKLYEMISEMKNGRFELIRSNIGWSEKKTIRHLDRLIEDKIVKEKEGVYFPTPVPELIKNWEEFTDEF